MVKSLREIGRGKVVVLGVGHALRADDAAGSAVAEALRARFPDRVFDGGQAPENFVGPVRRAKPDTIIVVDAADFGGRPGEVRVADAGEVTGDMTGTHAAPVSVFMTVLSEQTGAGVHLVAIQSKSNALGGVMCAEVAAAVTSVVTELETLLDGGTKDE
jgi:hydrogenase 3 maturation protease